MAHPAKHYVLRELAAFLSAKLQGNGDCIISSIAPLSTAQEGQISFLEKANYQKYLQTTQASAIILTDEFAVKTKKNALIVGNPYLCYAKISALFANYPEPETGINAKAAIGKNCNIAPSASIAANCVLGNRVTIGKNTQIDPGCVIGDDVEIGEDSKLYANVTLYYRVKIGRRAIIHSGAVIGSDGFGMAPDHKGHWHKIHQLGTVIIGDDVETGANTTIDRGALENTIIEDGVKLDNQIQIGHNVKIGAHTAIAGCVGIAGSTKIGKHCMIGGGAGIAGHIEIADGTVITARSAVAKSITKRGIYASGIPAMPHKQWWRILTRIVQLDETVQKVRDLERKHEHEHNKSE